MDLNPDGAARREPRFHVVFICTYSVDEPVAEVVEAARRLPNIQFSFTGDPAYLPVEIRRRLPENVRLTGFLPDEEYLALLRGADAILSLTTEDHTMQRGGYEAVALEKPLVTSDWPLLRQVFARGTVHADNSPDGIEVAIREIMSDPQRWGREMARLRRERERISAEQVGRLRRLLFDARPERTPV